ncbi:hypothetical protein LINPERHAP2_LOCUS15678 [Linum perenne]
MPLLYFTSCSPDFTNTIHFYFGQSKFTNVVHI